MKNKVYYVVNGKEITEDQVNEFIRNLGEDGLRFNNEEGRKNLANELLNQELFLLDAKENNLDENEDFKNEIEFAKEQILKQFAVKTLLDSAIVTDEDVKQFYEKNSDQFKDVYKFKAYHILVDNEEKAREIKEKINSGLNFEEAAKGNSLCPSAQRGGDLGEFQSGQMVPVFEQALIEMNIGDISSPVKSDFGYHIIRLDEKEIVHKNSYETFKDEIKRGLLNQKQQEVYLNKAKELKEKYSVEEK